jgi:hypothetical protein
VKKKYREWKKNSEIQPESDRFRLNDITMSYHHSQAHLPSVLPGMFDLVHLTNCCACSRKANLDVGEDVTEDGNARARHPAFFFGGERHRTHISQLGGVGIVFEGTEDGGLEVSSFPLSACCGQADSFTATLAGLQRTREMIFHR